MEKIGTQQMCACFSWRSKHISNFLYFECFFLFLLSGMREWMVSGCKWKWNTTHKYTYARTQERMEWLTRERGEENMFPNTRSVKRITQHTRHRVNSNIIRWKHFPFHRILILLEKSMVLCRLCVTKFQ